MLTRSEPDTNSPTSVIPILLGLKRLRWEPKWATAAACIDAAQVLNIQNLTSVSAALGAANSPAEPLRHIRNYFAHRGRGNSTLAMGTGYFTITNAPGVFQLNSYTTGGIP